jgi:hypothetical protein
MLLKFKILQSDATSLYTFQKCTNLDYRSFPENSQCLSVPSDLTSEQISVNIFIPNRH